MNTILKFVQWVRQFVLRAKIEDNYVPIKREPFEKPEMLPVINAVTDITPVPEVTQISKSKNTAGLIFEADATHKAERIYARKHLATLLDELSATFESYAIPNGQHPIGTDKATIKGIKTLGPVVPAYVAGGGVFELACKMKNDKSYVLPVDMDMIKNTGFMCMRTIGPKDDGIITKEHGRAEFIYATKLKKLPWYVEQKSGIAFEFGEGFKFTKDLSWIRSYVVVNSNGVPAFCKMLTVDRVVQKPTTNTVIRYAKKRYGNPLVDETNTDEKGTQSDYNEQKLLKDFWLLTHCWKLREYEWTVAVKRGKCRAQFSVPYNATKHFFKDRGKVVTVNGRTKPIMHYVSEHERQLRTGTTTVKEHIRGLRVFVWNEFQCFISAPKFHTIAKSTPPSGAEEMSDDELTPDGYVDMYDVAKKLVSYEEEGIRRH